MNASIRSRVVFALLGVALLASGSLLRAADQKADAEAKIKASIDKLPEADRAAALAQRWCAVQQGNRLGSMGAPIKVTLAGKTVFLCCGGCQKKANANAQATASAAETLKKINTSFSKLTATDRGLAEAQRFCAVMNQSRLGSMGPPVRVMLEGKPVFLCCGHCEAKAKANAKATLAKAEELKNASAAR